MEISKYDFWKYLQEKDANYFEGVNLVEKVSPNESLLNTLKGGVSVMNRHFLKKVMQKIYDDFPKQVVKIKKKAVKSERTKEPVSHKKVLTNDDFKRIADKELAAVYSERRLLSNQLYQCKTNDERATISDAIKDCIQDVNDLKGRLGIYKSTGVMPPKIILKGFEVAESDVALEKMIMNYRAKVSTQKKQLKDYDKKDRKKTKAAYELQLAELQNKLKVLEDERIGRKG